MIRKEIFRFRIFTFDDENHWRNSNNLYVYFILRIKTESDYGKFSLVERIK